MVIEPPLWITHNRLGLIYEKTNDILNLLIIWQKEAAYVDLFSATYFRQTSIDIGFQMGFDLSQNVLNLKLQ